jgi:hypothetical protein
VFWSAEKKGLTPRVDDGSESSFILEKNGLEVGEWGGAISCMVALAVPVTLSRPAEGQGRGVVELANELVDVLIGVEQKLDI